MPQDSRPVPIWITTLYARPMSDIFLDNPNGRIRLQSSALTLNMAHIQAMLDLGSELFFRGQLLEGKKLETFLFYLRHTFYLKKNGDVSDIYFAHRKTQKLGYLEIVDRDVRLHCKWLQRLSFKVPDGEVHSFEDAVNHLHLFQLTFSNPFFIYSEGNMMEGSTVIPDMADDMIASMDPVLEFEESKTAACSLHIAMDLILKSDEDPEIEAPYVSKKMMAALITQMKSGPVELKKNFEIAQILWSIALFTNINQGRGFKPLILCAP